MISQRPVFKKTSQFFIDAFIFILSYFAAFFIRFEGLPSGIFLKQMLVLFPYIALLRLTLFSLFGIYSIVWRYISIPDVISIVKTCLPVTIILFIGRLFLPDRFAFLRLPLGVIFLEFLLVLTGTLGVRMIRRFFIEQSAREKLKNSHEQIKSRRILLIGAGDAGNMVVKELKQRADLGIEVAGFIDDDAKKFRTVIQGTKVLGNTAQIPEIVKRLNIDEAIITIANASSRDIRRIVGVCERTKIKVKIVPGLFELLDDKVRVSKIREINIDDLLGRSVINFENHHPEIEKHYKNKKILITGAGGSIGSELCRQLASLLPKELIMLDKDENGIFEIDTELRRQITEFKLSPVIADIRDHDRLTNLFSRYRPEVVFHAAAHKHVPLMEFNTSEAVLNNVIGTKNVVRLADQFAAEKLIFISSDKAVNPTSIMGATKKIGEIILQELAPLSQTRFACVRFGNVLGSRGSVVPLFQKQIANGGPITVTHPDVARYFMSISEAVQLIIQAGTLGNKGEIFVLDMGKPIRIVDLARDLIRLSGHKEEEIEITHIGLRPGEKLREEILVDEERAKGTQFEKIFVAPPIEIDGEKFSTQLAELLKAGQNGDEKKIFGCLKEMHIGYNDKR